MAATASLQILADDATAPVFVLFRPPPAPLNKASLAFILSSSSGDQEMGHEPSECQQTVPKIKAKPKDRRRRIRLRLCEVDGCTKRAKFHRKCWHHGGSTECKIPGCLNRVKTKGLCWSHGGGTACSVAECTTIAVSHGVCWAHGGGKRCHVAQCTRSAYGNTKGLCKAHSKPSPTIIAL